jgi:nicotinamide-nucleotide amidase
MVAGALARSPADLAVAVTGIAGPGGAVPGKPVGTVWLAWGCAGRDQGEGHAQAQRQGQIHAERLQLPGDRAAVRQATVQAALRRLLTCARHGHPQTHTTPADCPSTDTSPASTTPTHTLPKNTAP